MDAGFTSFIHASYRLAVSSASVIFVGAMPALAQDQDQFYYQMSNQLGILRFCVDMGFPSEKSAKIYESFLASLPLPKDSTTVTINEQKGREGYYYMGDDSQMAVEQMAEGLNQTLEQHCQSFDENAKAFGG